jgi:putative transposase
LAIAILGIKSDSVTVLGPSSRPDRVWNRIPEAIRSQIVDLALDQPELSPRELAVRFTDEEKYFV